jgi:PIN domain nuclease of toxin-antitoxin system
VPEADPPSAPASVLDASAVMALLHDEPGADAVVDAIAVGTAISVVNWAEVLSNVALADRACLAWRRGSECQP